MVGRSGRKDCAALDQLLHDWDGRPTAPLRRRVGRHIDRCSVCSDRRRRELRPAALLSVAPGALVGFGLTGGGPGRLAGGGRAAREGPAGGRSRGARRRLPGAGGRHLPLQLTGFPQPAHAGDLGLVPFAHLPLSAAGGTAAAVTATVVVLAVVPMPTTGRRPAARR